MEDNFTKQQGEEIVKSILDMAVNYKNLSVKETTGDKTFIATIIKKESSGNYTIKMNGAIYTNIPSAYGYEYEINEKVECRANQGNMDLLEIITPKATKIDFGVIDNLTSTSTKDALSANMGRVLNESKLSTSTTYAQSDSIGGVANSSRLLRGADTRNTNENPLWYMQKGEATILSEFKNVAVLGLYAIIPTDFCQLTTFVTWYDDSAGYPVQMATASLNDGKIATRCGISNTAWSSWSVIDKTVLLYDRYSADPNINWGHPNGIYGGVEITNKDFTPYKYLMAYATHNDGDVNFVTIINTINANANYTASSSSITKGVNFHFQGYNLTNTSIIASRVGYYNNVGTDNFTNWQDRSITGLYYQAYYIYKIEGVLK